MRPPRPRHAQPASIDLRRGKRDTARGRGLGEIELGRERVDLTYLEQLAETEQTEAIARIIGRFASGSDDSEIAGLVDAALETLSEGGLESLGGHRGHPGAMSLPRAQEVAAALNRVRSLAVRIG